MIINKIIKAFGYFLTHILVAFELYLLALMLTSPVFNIVIGVLDIAKKVPTFILGKYLLFWIIASAVVWVGLFIYVEIRTHDLTKEIK